MIELSFIIVAGIAIAIGAFTITKNLILVGLAVSAVLMCILNIILTAIREGKNAK